MHRWWIGALAALFPGLSTPALAQSADIGQTAFFEPAALPLRLLFGLGLTAGGERLVTSFAGSTWSGALVHVHTGVRWEAAPWLSLQATIGLHMDSTDANVSMVLIEELSGTTNRDYVRFERYPVEALAHLRLNEQLAVGGGWRRALGPALRGNGAYRDVLIPLHSQPAQVAEIEYRFGATSDHDRTYAAVVLRGVRERYVSFDGHTTIRAHHGGLYLNVWF